MTLQLPTANVSSSCQPPNRHVVNLVGKVPIYQESLHWALRRHGPSAHLLELDCVKNNRGGCQIKLTKQNWKNAIQMKFRFGRERNKFVRSLCFFRSPSTWYAAKNSYKYLRCEAIKTNLATRRKNGSKAREESAYEQDIINNNGRKQESVKTGTKRSNRVVMRKCT